MYNDFILLIHFNGVMYECNMKIMFVVCWCAIEITGRQDVVIYPSGKQSTTVHQLESSWYFKLFSCILSTVLLGDALRSYSIPMDLIHDSCQLDKALYIIKGTMYALSKMNCFHFRNYTNVCLIFSLIFKYTIEVGSLHTP
jgi:hypothetical protein